MHAHTLADRRRLYLQARVVVARHYRRELTLPAVARALASSPRQLQRAYAQFGETTFREDLVARRLSVAAELLVAQRAIPVADVARLVGYRQPPHFAQAFRRRYGLSPARFRRAALDAVRRERALRGGADSGAAARRGASVEADVGPHARGAVLGALGRGGAGSPRPSPHASGAVDAR